MNYPPEPPVAHWFNAPSHDGILDGDIQDIVPHATNERLDQILWAHQRYYQSMAHYIRTCLACRDSARRMGEPSGTKTEWWDFVFETEFFLSTIESRMMFVVEEMARRYKSISQYRGL
jgi:hypothetical protein